MNNDIIQRLDELMRQPVYQTPTIRDAKAEIDRLRAELAVEKANNPRREK